MYNHDNIHFFMMSYWFLYWHFLAGHKSTLFWGMPCWIKGLALIFSLQSSDFRFRLYYHYKRQNIFFNFWDFGNTLLEGMCIRLTWPLYNHDMTQVMNMKEVLCMFMTTVIKCHSLSYVMFNAKMTFFDLPLPFPLTPPITKTSQTMSSSSNLLHIHYLCHVVIIKVSWLWRCHVSLLQVKCNQFFNDCYWDHFCIKYQNLNCFILTQSLDYYNNSMHYAYVIIVIIVT